jgi:hypothetical protein
MTIPTPASKFGFGFGFGFGSRLPREERQAARANPAGAAHRDVRRFRRRRRRLTEIPGLLADPAASSPGATLGRLSFGYFSLPFKEK